MRLSTRGYKGNTMETYCYHGRDTQGRKLFGGTTHARGWGDAAESVTRGLDAGISPSGRSIWVDKQGREVDLYLHISPEMTIRGAGLLHIARQEKTRREAEEQVRVTALEESLASLLDSMTPEQAIKRLKGGL